MFPCFSIFSRVVVLSCSSFMVIFFYISDSVAANISAPVANSGQTTSYANGDNGALQQGVDWPNPRFTNNGDGTITDNLTRLIWMQNANCWESMPWSSAISKVAGLNTGSESCSGYNGNHTDWHLPNFKELKSLIDAERYDPALPSGHPFSDVHSSYWSSTSYASNTGSAWRVNLYYGYVNYHYKTYSYYVWPVRGGQ